MNPTGTCFPPRKRALRCRARTTAIERLPWVVVNQLIRASKCRQPQIIRLLAAAAVFAVAVAPRLVAAQATPCVSCLVIGIDGVGLESARQLPPGSLDGVQLMVPAEASTDVLTET